MFYVLDLQVDLAFDTFTPERNSLHIPQGPLIRAVVLVLSARDQGLAGSIIPVAGELVEWNLDCGELLSAWFEGGLVAEGEGFPVRVGNSKRDVVSVIIDGGLAGDG